MADDIANADALSDDELRPKRRLLSLPWVRIGAEFLAIFAGVSLSLLADDWRQSRQERRAERQILGELSEDLRADSTELESMRARMTRWDVAAVWLTLSANTGVETDSVLRRVAELTTLTFYQPVNATYTGLKDGGQIRLIRDPELRRHVIEYYEVRQPYMLQFDSRLAMMYTDFVDIATDHFAVPPASATSFWPFTRMNVVTSIDSFVHDARTRSRLQLIGISAANWAARIGPVLEENTRLRTMITSEVGG